jgi:hypothetical protein
MPHTTYGLLKAIRSHQIDSPSVNASLATGRPNACNQCHLDKTLQWSADHLDEWWGIPEPTLTRDEQEIAASVLWTLRGHAAQRALMAWSMGWEPALLASRSDWQAPFLVALLTDPYDAVRAIAYRSLSQLDGFADFEYDYVGSVPELEAAKRPAYEIWSRRHLEKGGTIGAQILIDEPGRVQTAELSRLLEHRDDRPVHFAE